MGIWQHIHTITTTDISPDLGEFSEILDDVSVEMIPICYRWGFKHSQTASHIHVIVNLYVIVHVHHLEQVVSYFD